MAEQLKTSISIKEHFLTFKEDSTKTYSNKNIKLNAKALKAKEQLELRHNYTAFIAKVETINAYIIKELSSRGIRATLSGKKRLTKPQLEFRTFPSSKIYTREDYQYVELENFLPTDGNGCAHSFNNTYDKYAITIMPDRAAANNPQIRINFGKVYMSDKCVMSWKDRSRQSRYETHKFAKQTDPSLFISSKDSYDQFQVSTVEQDNSDINIDELIDFAESYQSIINTQTGLLVKERKKTGLRMARNLRPINKVLETCGFECKSDLNLDKYVVKALDQKIGYYDKCRYYNGKVMIEVVYNQTYRSFKYDVSVVDNVSDYSNGTKFKTYDLIDIPTFTDDVKHAESLSNEIKKLM